MHTDNEHEPIENKKLSNKGIIIAVIVLLVCVFLFFLLRKNTDAKKDTFVLVGSNVTLRYKEEYIEPGYSYIDKDNNDKTSLVKVTNTVNSEIPGSYAIYYEYNNQILTRTVIVLEPSVLDLTIEYNVDNSDITKEDVNITYKIIGEMFDKVELPDGTISSESTGNFVVTANGTYRITAYNTKNQFFDKTIVIDNIDKEPPTGTCTAVLNNQNTEIKVTASDNNEVAEYEYLDNNKTLDKTANNIYVTNGTTTKTILVKIFDKVGNSNTITCVTTDNRYHEAIKPNSNENVVFKGETDTLKVYISKMSGYHLTRIWAKDAYSQLNKAVSSEYGIKRYLPETLLKQAMQEKSLQNKLVIGFNASGFYLKGTYDAESVNLYPAYNNTSVGTIVINNGVVVRNSYQYSIVQWCIMGINKNNQMLLFKDYIATTSKAIEEKKAWSQTVINSGIRNTLTFAGPIIENGKALTSFYPRQPLSNDTEKPLQLMCQIDENNYALFTSSSSTRNTGIKKFLELGCKTAVNLDGGGSVALYYKAKNSTTFTKVLGGGRDLPETAYFTE